jgi:hypothetical protein
MGYWQYTDLHMILYQWAIGNTPTFILVVETYSIWDCSHVSRYNITDNFNISLNLKIKGWGIHVHVAAIGSTPSRYM